MAPGKNTIFAEASKYFLKKYGEKYKKAKKIATDTQTHIFDTMANTGVADYEEIAKILAGIAKKLGYEAVTGDVSKLRYDPEKDVFQYENRTVVPVEIPLKTRGIVQFVVPFDKKGEPKKLRGATLGTVSEGDEEDLRKRVPNFADIVLHAVNERASDIHITYDSNYYYVNFRIDGELRKMEGENYVMNKESGRFFVKMIMIEAQRSGTKGKFSPEERMIAQDARISYPDLSGNKIDVRLVFIPDGMLTGDLAVVARILKMEKIDGKNVDLKGLGYLPDFVDVIERAKRRRNGLFIVSGVTGSGKSTLVSNVLATMVGGTKKINTIEDPIEYRLEGFNVQQMQTFEIKQSENDKKTKKMGFLEYVKALKRGDPDVVLIGEMRNDPELVKAVQEMSKAGQLIFSTVHIPSAFDIYSALSSVFEIPMEDVIAIVLFSANQTLTKKICPHCRVEDEKGINTEKLMDVRHDLPYAMKNSIEWLREDFKRGEVRLYLKGDGCDKCSGGYAPGRTPMYEYFYPDMEFMEHMHVNRDKINRIFVEKYALEKKKGKNKLDIFVEKLRMGLVDTSDEILEKLM